MSGAGSPIIDSGRVRRRWASHVRRLAAGGLVISWVSFGCGGSGGSAVGTVEGSIVPCDQGEAAFDVWRADFDPSGKVQIAASMDTRDAATAAEFRLVIACDGEVVVDTTRGINCSFPPPSKSGQGTPECPFDTIDVADLGSGRVECLAEITTTEPLDIGVGRCADPAIAKYKFRMQIDSRPLALDLVADDCRDESSCLEKQFGIDVD